MTRLQQLADPDYLARVFSIREMVTMGSYSVGCLIVGYGAQQAGSAAVSSGLAVFGAAAGLIWLLGSRGQTDSRTGRQLEKETGAGM